MAKLEVLEVKVRDQFGKRRNRRMREGGLIPATLYGHKKEAQSLCVPQEQMTLVIRHGGHLVQLTGDISERALLKEVQWDVWGKTILHVDLARVDAFEKIHVRLPLTLRGEAPGVRQGGVIEQLVHEVELECSATDIPDAIEVRIGDLEIGGHVSVSAIELSGDVKILLSGDTPVVHCIVKREVNLEEAAPAEGAEPEMIAKKKAEEAAE